MANVISVSLTEEQYEKLMKLVEMEKRPYGAVSFFVQEALTLYFTYNKIPNTEKKAS